MNGSSYAWHVGAGGLQLIPTETGGSEGPRQSVDCSRVGVPRRVSASDVLQPRARSPFERHPGAQSGPGDERPQKEPRALKPTVSEPKSALEWDQSRDRQGELTWYGASVTAPPIPADMSSASVVDPTAMAAMTVHVHAKAFAPTPPAEIMPKPVEATSTRAVTPIKPRIVYPISPGGTEIKPPPMHGSPRRGTRSPSPVRAKTIVPPPQPVVEPQSDIQRLVVALEALRQGKGSESDRRC